LKLTSSTHLKNADVGLGYRIVKHLSGVYKALNSLKTSTSGKHILLQKYFYELCPFWKFK